MSEKEASKATSMKMFLLLMCISVFVFATEGGYTPFKNIGFTVSNVQFDIGCRGHGCRKIQVDHSLGGQPSIASYMTNVLYISTINGTSQLDERVHEQRLRLHNSARQPIAMELNSSSWREARTFLAGIFSDSEFMRHLASSYQEIIASTYSLNATGYRSVWWISPVNQKLDTSSWIPTRIILVRGLPAEGLPPSDVLVGILSSASEKETHATSISPHLRRSTRLSLGPSQSPQSPSLCLSTSSSKSQAAATQSLPPLSATGPAA
eukprot:767030-Hanusia_phi.AAC.1